MLCFFIQQPFIFIGYLHPMPMHKDKNSRECTTPTYFPSPLTRQEATGLTILCLVYELKWNNFGVIGLGHVFVAKSADCVGCRGEGNSVEESVQDFKEVVECVVLEKVGGVFTDQSSEQFQRKYFDNTVREWNHQGVKVVSITAYECKLFS